MANLYEVIIPKYTYIARIVRAEDEEAAIHVALFSKNRSKHEYIWGEVTEENKITVQNLTKDLYKSSKLS